MIIYYNIFSKTAEVTIGLVPTSVTVAENEGSVEFCAEVMGTVALQRTVQVTFQTIPGTASGSYNTAKLYF